MARRKNAEEQDKKTILLEVPLLEVPSDSDLAVRMGNVSEYTGLPYLSLIQKWLTQEEAQISILRHRENDFLKRIETQLSALKTKAAPEPEPDAENYRQEVYQRIAELKAQGMTFFKIARLFNDENIRTISGVGKWHPATVSQIFNAKTNA
jgi:hypothetical protein